MGVSGADRVAELVAENTLLRARCDEQQSHIARLVEQNSVLVDQVSLLVTKVMVLEKLLKGDSSNSSRPPSSDSDTAKNKRPVANSRTMNPGTKRSKGKQPGAQGRTLRTVPDPDVVIVHSPVACQGCGSSLDDAVVVGKVVRQVFDIPAPKVIVTEHQALRCRCSCGSETSAPLPAEATSPACYGPNVKAYAIYLLCRQHVPQERCAEALAEMFGVAVSVGTLNNWLSEAADALDSFVAAVTIGLGQAPVIHVDETPVRSNKTKAYFHVACTAMLTLLWVHIGGRARTAIDAGPLPSYAGVAVHDRYIAYFSYPCGHALCNAHILRQLQSVAEVRRQQVWTNPISDLIRATKTEVDNAAAAGKTCLLDRRMRRIRHDWDHLIAVAYATNPDPPKSKPRNYLEREAYNLAVALDTHRDLFLAYATNFNINYTNNQAEQDLRMVKIQAKISGEFRSLRGAQRFATIRSYISTTHKHGLSILDNIARLYTTTGPWLPPLTPTG